MTYRPLPKCLTVAKSKIDGLGLFATKDIEADTDLGLFHFYHNDEIIRTPLAGFCNHADKSNCYKHIMIFDDHKKVNLFTKDKIKKGEELTLTYDLYKPQ